MKVLIKAPLGPHSAYAYDGMSLALAFVRAGADVYLQPASVQPPLPADVAELLTRPPRHPFDLLINLNDPTHLGLTFEERATAAVTIAWTGWNYTTLDNCPGRSALRKRLADFDLTVGYDAVSTAALRPYVSDSIATVQGGYWPENWPAAARDWNDPTLRVLCHMSRETRFTDLATIAAFKEVQEQRPDLNIRLTLKAPGDGLFNATRLEEMVPGLEVIDEYWPDDMMRGLYARHHLMLCAKTDLQNRPALEFLSSGAPVIAVNFGGHTQWLSSSIGYSLDHTLVPLSKAKPACCWAGPSHEHLKQMLLHAADNRIELRRKGEAAATIIPGMCSWPAAIDRLIDIVGQHKGFGSQILHSYRRDKEKMQESRQAVSFL